MAYFILEKPPAAWFRSNGSNLRSTQDWLVSIPPMDRILKVLAYRDQGEKAWRKYCGSTVIFPAVEFLDVHDMFRNSDSVQEIPKEEACLILFGMLDEPGVLFFVK